MNGIWASENYLWKKGNTVVLFGDSRTAQCGTSFAPSSVTSSGTVVTVTATAHKMQVGQKFPIGGAVQTAYNGVFTVATIVDANNFTYAAYSTPSASPATGSVYFTNGLLLRDYGYFNWLNAKLGGRFNVLFNAGIGGDSVQDMALRIGDVLPYDPNYCFVQGGYNDLPTRSADQIIADFTTIFETLTRNKILVVALTEAPLHSSAGNYSAANAQKVLAVNNWMRNYARLNKGVLLLDVFAAFVDGTSATGQALADMQWGGSDHVHWTPKGSRTIGNAGYNLLNSIVPAGNTLASSLIDDYTTDATNPNIVINGMMVGTGGTANTGITGTVANNWSMSRTGSATAVGTGQVARADGLGYDQQIAATYSASGEQIQLFTTASLHARIVAGQEYYIEADISVTGITGSCLGGFYHFLQTTINGIASETDAAITANTEVFDQTDMTNFVWRSPNLKFPAGATVTSTFVWFRFYSKAAGTLTAKVGRVVLRKVT
jgi:lysophospholipase L1-like esterase